jgi:hypothetical protein
VSLLDPYALPYDFLATLFHVDPGVSFDPIMTRATGDVVLAPIHRPDMVLSTPPAGFVRAAAKAQRVVAPPSVDAVSAPVAVDSLIIRGAYKSVGSLIALDGSRLEARIVVLGNPVYG